MAALLKRTILISASLALIIGCATIAGGGQGVYEENLGTATPNDISNLVPEILRNRYNYSISRVEEDPQSNNFYLETMWKEDLPIHEGDSEMSSRRMRIVVEGRPRVRTGGGGSEVSTLRLTVQKEARNGDSAGWIASEFTEDEEQYIRDIADQLRTDIVEGVRTY